MGVTEGLTSIASGITSDLSSLTSTKAKVEQCRPQRYMPSSRWDKAEIVLQFLNVLECYAQDHIRKKPKHVGVPRESFFGFVSADTDTYIIFSSTHIYIMSSSFVTRKAILLESMKTFTFTGKLTVDIRYNQESFTITCTNAAEFEKLERLLVEISRTVATTSSIVSFVAKVGASATSGADTVSSTSRYLEYEFGKLNETFTAKTISDEAFLLSFRESYSRTDLSPLDLDRQLNYLVRQWEANHGPGSGNSRRGSGMFGGGGMLGTGIGGMRSVRCAALLILNESASVIKIVGMKVIVGERLCIFGDGSYSDGSNLIAPHSAVVLFVCGSMPKLVETSDAAAEIQTTAFTVTFGRKKEILNFEGSPGFEASFLERDFGSSYGKHFLLVV